MQSLGLIVIAYLLGSIPSGKLIGFLHHKDIQKLGSGNIGFANAVRVLGWPSGIAVLVGDVLKSFLPLLIAKHILQVTDGILMLMTYAAVIGHAFPVWLRFKGGKSIATGLGALLVIAPGLALVGIGVYCVVLAITHTSGKGSLAGAWSLPIVGLIGHYDYPLFLLVLAIFASYTHRANIKAYVATKSK